jgi:hypothetical protein
VDEIMKNVIWHSTGYPAPANRKMPVGDSDLDNLVVGLLPDFRPVRDENEETSGHFDLRQGAVDHDWTTLRSIR